MNAYAVQAIWGRLLIDFFKSFGIKTHFMPKQDRPHKMDCINIRFATALRKEERACSHLQTEFAPKRRKM